MAGLKTFIVEGPRTSFPVDMLRYDSCWPLTTEDARKIENILNEGERLTLPRRVRVQLQTSDRNFNVPTAARWDSFMWRVVEGD